MTESVIKGLIKVGIEDIEYGHCTGINSTKDDDSNAAPLTVAAIIINILDVMNIDVETKTLEDIGGVSLNIFLTLTVMSLEIWLLLDLAIPLIVLLVVQSIFMMTIAILLVFTIIGKDYDAMVMSAGMCGVGIGSTPNAVANMQAVIDDNGLSPVSMALLPPIVSIVLSVINPIIISLFIEFLSKYRR